jgi:hypothetical protein
MYTSALALKVYYCFDTLGGLLSSHARAGVFFIRRSETSRTDVSEPDTTMMLIDLLAGRK